MSFLLEDFRSFVHASPTSWHASHEIGNRLALKSFVPLDEKQKWNLEKGGKYFIHRGGSICAFVIPHNTPTRSVILGAHTDSPALKLKPNPSVLSENMVSYGVEVYGGPLLSSWLNRDLGIAGRIVVRDKEGRLEEKLIFIDDAPLIIPQLAIHLDKDVNEKGVILNKQDHLAAIATLSKGEPALYLETLIRRSYTFHELISHELFLVPLEQSRYLGSQGELLASYRIDNLASTHAALAGLASCQPQAETLQMAFFWDHEEIGSSTQEGACSPFFSDTLERIALSLNLSKEDLYILKNRSLAVSIDMAQAFNPNYPQKYDNNHRPLLGKGVTIKFNANQKYVSNAPTAACIAAACLDLNLSYQNYSARADIPSGSTIGPLFATVTGIPTVDIGTAQLSMHSTREIMSCSDHLDLCKLLTHLLEKKYEF